MGNASGGNHVGERPKRLKEGCVSVTREWTNDAEGLGILRQWFFMSEGARVCLYAAGNNPVVSWKVTVRKRVGNQDTMQG